MASQAEKNASRSLRQILASISAGADIPRSDVFQDALVGLEYFLPGVLREIHPEWHEESLDGIFPVFARKTAEGEAEIYGQCILITDQTLTAIHVRLQIDASKDEISWLECRLGEMGEDGMVRRPYKFARIYDLTAAPDMIDWAYKVTFGEKRIQQE